MSDTGLIATMLSALDIHDARIWAGIAVTLGIAEVLTGSGWLLGLALGGGIMAGMLAIDALPLARADWAWVLLTWALASAVCVIVVRSILKTKSAGNDINTYARRRRG